MSASDGADAPPGGWQPFTFGGVAAFAKGPTGRVFAFELAAAMTAAICVMWFLHRAYCPVILQAIQKMPDSARIAQGTLQGVTNTLIAESKFLGLAARPQTGEQIGQGADLQIELRQSDFCVNSIFWPDWGLDYPYQRGPVLNLGRASLEPWWSAWQPVVLTIAGAAVAVSLLLTWTMLALIYMAPAKFIAWFADRYLSWGGAWRLASAALMPGAAVMIGAIVLYGWSGIDLVGLTFFFAIHFIMGWVYLVGASCKADRVVLSDSNRNPFTA
jgi:hypothetical protein